MKAVEQELVNLLFLKELLVNMSDVKPFVDIFFRPKKRQRSEKKSPCVISNCPFQNDQHPILGYPPIAEWPMTNSLWRALSGMANMLAYYEKPRNHGICTGHFDGDIKYSGKSTLSLRDVEIPFPTVHLSISKDAMQAVLEKYFESYKALQNEEGTTILPVLAKFLGRNLPTSSRSRKRKRYQSTMVQCDLQPTPAAPLVNDQKKKRQIVRTEKPNDGVTKPKWCLCEKGRFVELTGISKDVFFELAKRLEDRFNGAKPSFVNDEPAIRATTARQWRYVFPGCFDWPCGTLFFFLVNLRNQFSRSFLISSIGMSATSVLHCSRIMLPMVADLLRPLVSWPPATLEWAPPEGFFLTPTLRRRLEKENANILGVLDVVTLETILSITDDSWKTSFIIVYNLHGAVIYRSRFYWWKSGIDKGLTVKENRSTYQKIIDSCFQEDLRFFLASRKDRLLSVRRYFDPDNGNNKWLWASDENELGGKRNLNHFLIDKFGKRLHAFRMFRCPQARSWMCHARGHMEEMVDVCCDFVCLMPAVDWTVTDKEGDVALADMF